MIYTVKCEMKLLIYSQISIATPLQCKNLQFHIILYNWYIYLSILGLKLNHVNKRAPKIKSVTNAIYAHFTRQSISKSFRNLLTRSINQPISISCSPAHFLYSLTTWLTDSPSHSFSFSFIHSQFIHNNSKSGTQYWCRSDNGAIDSGYV